MKRIASSVLAVAILVTGMGWAYFQDGLLRQRVSPHAFDRYAVDITLPNLPQRVTKDHLLALCPNGPPQPAACIDRTPEKIPADIDLAAIAKSFQFAIQEQMLAAEAITAIPADHHAFADFQQFADEYRGIGQSTLATMSDLAITASTEQTVTENDPPSLERLQRTIQRSGKRTQRELEHTLLQFQAASSQQARWEAAKNLGLLASGLRLNHDYGTQPPSPTLLPDRSLLAEQIEWLRRASRNAADNSAQRTYGSALTGIALSGSIAVIIAIALGIPPTLVAAIPVCLAASWLMLADIGLTGPSALRYLPILQFSPIWARIGPHEFPLHLPLLVFGIGLAVLRLSWSDPMRWCWRPAENWIATGSALRTTLAGLLLLTLATALVLTKGYSAGISELLIALGVLAIANYTARQAAIAGIGGKFGWYTLPVLLLGVTAAVVGSLARGDLGHVGVALALLCVFLFLFLHAIWAGLLLLVLLCGVALLLDYPGNPASPLNVLITTLEQVAPHAAERFLLLKDAFNHGPSDLARTTWLQMISGNDGWGIGYVPWLGLPGARIADGLPLQAPSDYAFSIAQAIWGWTGAWCLMSVAALIFLASAWRGCRIALGDGSSFMHRFIAAIGALGCIAVLAKALLSVAGTTRLLPLTGVPIALLSYAPAAMWAGLGYIALVLTIPRADAVSA